MTPPPTPRTAANVGNRVNGRSPALAAAVMGNGVARRYRKTALVWAMPLSEEAVIETPEGEMVCHIGDYLASDDPPTHLWPVRRDVFEATYIPAEAASPRAGLRASEPLRTGWYVKGWDADRILFEDMDEREHWVARAALAPAQGGEPTTDMLLTLTAAVEEFWPSDKPGATLLAPETAAEIVNFMHANGYQIDPIVPASPPLTVERLARALRATSVDRTMRYEEWAAAILSELGA